MKKTLIRLLIGTLMATCVMITFFFCKEHYLISFLFGLIYWILLDIYTKMNKNQIIYKLEELKKDTTYKNGMCASCEMDHYDCDCGTFNYAIEKAIELIKGIKSQLKN